MSECGKEFLYGGVLKRIHRDDLVMGEDDTDRDGDIERIAFVE